VSVRPRAALAVVALFTATLMGVGVQPAHASLGQPLTHVFLDSEADDTVGGGATLDFSSVLVQGTSGRVSFAFGPVGTWSVVIQPVPGGALTTGTYENAQPADIDHPGHPGLTASTGGNCLQQTSRFIIDGISFDGAGAINSIALRFEHHCEARDPALFGAISYNSTIDYRTRSLNSNSMGFPVTQVGKTSVAHTETITNQGPSSLTVSSAGITGTNASDFHVVSSTCGSSLSQGQACSVGVTFSPAAAGNRVARLTLFDQLAPAGGGGTGRDVVLSGTGGGPTWAPLNGFVASDPVAVASGSSLKAYALDTGGDLRVWTSNNGVWDGGVTFGGQFASVPSPVATSGGVYVFGLARDDSLFYTGPSNPYIVNSLGGGLLSTPAGETDATGVYVFGVGLDHALYYRRLSGGTWSAWQSLGGYLTSDLATAVDSTGLYVFGRGGDGSLWYRRFVGGVPSGWQGLGGYMSSFPAAVSDPSGINVFIRGGDGAGWYRRVTGTPSGWASLGGYFLSALSAVTDQSGLHVFGVGGDHAMWFRRLTVQPSGWAALGGYLVSNPSAVSDPTGGGVQVLALGGDQRMWVRSV